MHVQNRAATAEPLVKYHNGSMLWKKKKKKYDQETITAGKTLHVVEKTSHAI